MNAPHPAHLVREQLYRDMSPLNLTPLWGVLHALVPREPATPCVPALWRYDEVRPFLMRAGDAITARVEVIEVLRERNRIRLQTVCVNQRDEEVLSGEAWVMPSRTPVVYEGRPVSAASLAALTLAPWTWAAQTMALWGMMSLSMLAPGAPRRG